MSLFKANYGYILRILLTLRQAKKISIDTKESIKGIIKLHKNLQSIAKMVQEYIKKIL